MVKLSKVTKKAAALFLAVAITVPSYMTAAAAPAKTLYEKVSDGYEEPVNLTDDIYYNQYLDDLNKKGAEDYSGNDIVLKIAGGKYSPRGNFIETSEDANGEKRRSIDWTSDKLDSVEWSVDVKTAGYYNIEVDYLAVTGSTTAPQRELYIDGRKKFNEMSVFSFPRKWEDDGEITLNALGDQIRPKQKEVFEWSTTTLVDSQGKFNEPLKFYLDKGRHTIRFVYANEPMRISEVRLTAPKHYKTYEEAVAEYKQAGYNYYSGKEIKIQAEDAVYRSDPSLRIQSDSDPLAQPVSGVEVVYNSIGGGVWSRGNQSITWYVNAPEDGLYKIAWRIKQNYTDGMPVYRQISINGEVPFEEFLDYRINYDDAWRYEDIRNVDAGEPYAVYLKKGVNEITMTARLGDFAHIITTLEKDAYRLSQLIQRIIKITTVNPDANYDYDLENKIPDLLDEFQSISDSLEKQVADIRALSEKNPSSVNNLLMIKSQIDNMIKDPFVIARGLSELMDSQSTMATWISDFQNSPVLIDYMSFKPVESATEDYKSNFLAQIGVAFQSFFISFVKDYDAIGASVASEDAKTINVWVSRAKEWAEVLQYMIDEEFTPDTNVAVKMNVVPANSFTSNGVIMLAIAAGNAPDMALGVTASVPFEYGIRDAIYDLSKFEDYNQVVERFLPGMMIPFQHNGACYAFPETMDFSVMFYRSDILESLEIEVPETWDELYSKVLPILKKNGMDFFYDGAVSSVSGSVSAAFHSLLYQNGGTYYTEDGKSSALDSPGAFAAFKQFTELYTIYGMDVSANVYSRFRAGTMPLAVGPFATYIQLTAAAPEISGKWDVAPIPGVKQADGKINRSYGGGTTAAMILSATKEPEACWEFLKWYTDADTQTRYANDITSTVGAEARWCSANIEAFDNISWETNLKDAIAIQREWYVDMPNVIGGYITPRYIENARVRVVVQGKQYRDSLEKTVKDINRELVNKNEEFARREAKEAENQ